MRHLDLFAGIGGFALASRWCGWQTVGFCERDPWCQRVLAKNFPGVPIHDDIHTLTGDIIRDWGGADVLTGGFPCQPYSQAGRQTGAVDDRALWPEMRRVINACRPRWVLGENTVGIIKVDLDRVLADLEADGYTTGTVCLSALSVGARHKRERVWVVAHAGRIGDGIPEGQVPTGRKLPLDRSWWDTEPRVGRVADGVPNRVDRIRGLGNAIVPQVAYEIMRGMA